jgi:hypothetical protein
MGIQIAQRPLAAVLTGHRQAFGLNDEKIVGQHGLGGIEIARTRLWHKVAAQRLSSRHRSSSYPLSLCLVALKRAAQGDSQK